MSCERCKKIISAKEQSIYNYCPCDKCGNLPKAIVKIFDMYPLCFDCIKELKKDKKYKKRLEKFLKE